MKVSLYIKHSLKVGDVIPVPSNKLHYVQNVLKLKTAFKVFIFNQNDGEFEGILQEAKTPLIKIIQFVRPPHKSNQIKINLVFANIKNNLASDVLNSCTQIGVDEFYPLITERTTNHHFSTDRAEKIIEEAVEQCGRIAIPKVNPLIKFADIFNKIKQSDTIIFCDEKASFQNNPIKIDKKEYSIFIFIGPEGGFSESERLFLQSKNALTISLGQFVLRAENASVCASFLISQAINN